MAFDLSKHFNVPILSGTVKRCVVRFPADEEWCGRARRQRSIRRFLGRGKTETQDIESDAVNAELFARIRQDKDGPAFDDAEAAAVLAKLELARVEACDREGDTFRVVLKVPGADTEHVLRMPTQRERDEHEKASVRYIGERRAQEIRGFLEPSGALYDRIHVKHEGYAGAVSIVHKVAAVSEVLAQLAGLEEEAVPEP